MLAQAAKVAEEMQKQYPDLDLTSGWWKPAINLSADSQVSHSRCPTAHLHAAVFLAGYIALIYFF